MPLDLQFKILERFVAVFGDGTETNQGSVTITNEQDFLYEWSFPRLHIVTVFRNVGTRRICSINYHSRGPQV